jgi:hypothetical protein
MEAVMRRTLIALGLAAAGCATTSLPPDRTAQSQAAILSAEAAGARQVAPAAVHLQLAHQELDAARQLIHDGYNERGRYLLLRAEADANLALTMAQADSMRLQANATINQVRALQ